MSEFKLIEIPHRKRNKVPKEIHLDWSLISGRFPHMNEQLFKDNQVWNFETSLTTDGVFTTSTSTPTSVGLTFTGNAIPEFASFTAIFDQYRMVKVRCWFIPGSASTSSLWKSVVDYDNTATTATSAFFDEYNNCHTSTLSNCHYREFQLHAAIAAYSGTFTSFANEPSPWIDCASPSVAHYGVKLYAETSVATASVSLITKYWFQFRNKI
jgi:hypothetical protein